MTIQQLYDIALEEGALNYDISLVDPSFDHIPMEGEFIFDHKKHRINIQPLKK